MTPIDESELVIVCHCPVPLHKQLFYVENGVLGTPLGPDVKYVDPDSCPENTWDKIEPGSKTFIWGMHCPVYHIFKSDTSLRDGNFTLPFLDIVKNSWIHLKTGGKLVFPIPKSIEPACKNNIQVVQDFIDADQGKFGSWEISIIDVSEFPFCLSQINRANVINIPGFLIVFTKIEVISAGKNKNKNTNTNKNKTRNKSKSGKRKRTIMSIKNHTHRKNLSKRMRRSYKKNSKCKYRKLIN